MWRWYLEEWELNLIPLNITESARKYFAESLSWSSGNHIVAEAGRLSSSVLKQFGIDQDVFYGHIEWDYLLKMAKKQLDPLQGTAKIPRCKKGTLPFL